MRTFLYVVEYRRRDSFTNRWKAWVPSIDAGVPYMNKRACVQRAEHLELLTQGELQYRAARYARSASRSGKL